MAHLHTHSTRTAHATQEAVLPWTVAVCGYHGGGGGVRVGRFDAGLASKLHARAHRCSTCVGRVSLQRSQWKSSRSPTASTWQASPSARTSGWAWQPLASLVQSSRPGLTCGAWRGGLGYTGLQPRCVGMHVQHRDAERPPRLTRMRAVMVSVSSVTKPAAGRASSADSPKLERAVWSGWPQSVTAAVKRWRK